ncbi:helix-turn-helix domain-containing protein [Desulforudis sp. 1031]
MRTAGSGIPASIRNRVERVTFTLPEAMVYSGLGRSTLLRLLQAGEIRGRKVGARRWLILKDSLESWLRGQ